MSDRKKRQLDIFSDLPRGEQLKLLRDIQLSEVKVGTTKVKPVVQKAVLRAIDDRNGDWHCFASQITLAIDVNVSVSTVGRAIKALETQDLITKERHGCGTNRHTPIWSSIRQHVDANPRPDLESKPESTTGQGDVTIGHPDRCHRSPRPMPSVTLTGATGHPDRSIGQGDRQNANQTKIQTPPPIVKQDARWVEVVGILIDWGLVTAATACESAKAFGWSPEYVLEIHASLIAGEIPPTMQPGRLANILSGRVPPPFDGSEVDDRRGERLRREANAMASHEKSAAEQIRNQVRHSAKRESVPEWVILGTTCRRLREAGLDSFATSEEIDSADRMDSMDRERNSPPIGMASVKTPPRRESLRSRRDTLDQQLMDANHA